MADRRLLATSITESGQVASLVARCGPWAALFFTWCVPFIDDDSRLVGDPDTLRHKVLGRYLGQVSVEDVTEFLDVMDELGLIVWYAPLASPAERYVYVPKFSLHQTLRADRYGPSRYPPPPRWEPEEGHPYAKVPGLKASKPQRDTRRTMRVRDLVRDRPATGAQPPGATRETAAQPLGDQSATAPRTSGRKPAAEDSARLPASPRASPPLDSPPRVSPDAAGPAASQDADRSRDQAARRLDPDPVDEDVGTSRHVGKAAQRLAREAGAG